MKNIHILLLILFLMVACRSTDSNLKSDLDLANIRGNVKELVETVHDAGARALCPFAHKDDFNQSLSVYNENGNLIKYSGINANGDTTFVSRYLYGKNGICKKIEKYSNNRLTEKEVPVIRGGKLTETRLYDGEGKIKSRYRYSYSDDNLSECIVVDDKGSILNSTRNEFSNGQIVQRTEINESGVLKSISRLSRNPQNDVIESYISIPEDSSEIKFRFEYEYDDKGNWTKQIQFFDGRIVNVVIRNFTYYNI